MIHLANDPNATRHGWRPSQEAGKGRSFERGCGRHAWPFPSRYTERPASDNGTKTRNGASGS
jgi:hypothetical protein